MSIILSLSIIISFPLSQHLPSTDDDMLKRLLAVVQEKSDDRRSLAEWARTLGTTERTLSRRCGEHLGISFHRMATENEARVGALAA